MLFGHELPAGELHLEFHGTIDDTSCMRGRGAIFAGGFKPCPVKKPWSNFLPVGKGLKTLGAAMPVCTTFTNF
jgi:hypothetical protein